MPANFHAPRRIGDALLQRVSVAISGHTQDAWLRLPPAFDPGKPYPLLCNIGPRARESAQRTLAALADRTSSLLLTAESASIHAAARAQVLERYPIAPDSAWMLPDRGSPDERFAQKRLLALGKTPFPTRLTMEITNLRSDRGRVLALLFARADGFPDRDQSAIASLSAPISDDRSSLTVDTLAPGVYAAVFFHDENANSRLDTSFGFPTEGFGASNNPKPRLGPPRWDDCRFCITGAAPERRITIETVYLGPK